MNMRLAKVSTLLVTCMGAGISHASSTGSANLIVEDPRPVAKVVQEMESRYGYVITYEDPRYSNDEDVSDVTDAVQTNPNASASRVRTLIPVGGRLSLVLPDSSKQLSAEQVGDLLQLLVQTQAATQQGGRFRLERTGETFHVVPSEIRDKSGDWHSVAPVMDADITLERSSQSNGLELLNGICAAVSQSTSQRVWLGSAPTSVLSRYHGRLSVSHEAARTVLTRLLSETGSPMSWNLFYDVGLQEYFLNVIPVPGRSNAPKNVPKEALGISTTPMMIK
jgi:hypothetical protein